LAVDILKELLQNSIYGVENEILILMYPSVRCGQNLIFALYLPSCRSSRLIGHIQEKMFHLFAGVPE